MCAASTCKGDYDACLTVFDSCACIAGQLTCVELNCPSDLKSSLKECQDAMTFATSCVLNCAAGAYPHNPPADSTVMMTVVGSISLSGLNVAQFKAVEVEFKAALASTVSCPVENIHITNITERSDQRLRQRQRLLEDTPPSLLSYPPGSVSPRHLQRRENNYVDVEFDISVPSAIELKATTAILQGR